MECETIEEELLLFNDICTENDSDSEDDCLHWRIFGKPIPHPPPEPKTTIKFIDFEKYVEEKCENKIRVLDRSTFNQIKRPFMICFNHFREKCFYLTKYLDRLYQLALKYEDQIDFIVADQMDMDVIYPHTNPITFFCCLVSPEDESLHTFIINKKKQIYQHYDAYQTVETLSEVCDKLLNGNLYISQPIPEQSDTLVKLAVHLNYDELVTKSTKDILLIVGLGEYKKFEEYEPNYEEISYELREANFEVVYIDSDKNYVAFNLNANCYPTIIFIPHNDKDNFVHFSNYPRDTETVLGFIKENIGPQGETLRSIKLTKNHYKPFSLPTDYELEFQDLHQYISDSFPKSFNVFDRTTFQDLKQCIIIYFMNFEEKGVSFYLETLKKIYQVAENKSKYGISFMVADLKDVDILYPKWYKKYMVDPQKHIDTSIPNVFAIDRLRHTYEVDDFATASSLCYFYFDLTYSKLFYSQPRRMPNNALVTTCVAHNLKLLIKKCKRDIFLTIYRPNYKESFHILNILDEIADDMQELNVKIFKLDGQHNYVPLEYRYDTYPVHFFIPCRDKDNGTTRYISSHQSKGDILEFIRENLHKT